MTSKQRYGNILKKLVVPTSVPSSPILKDHIDSKAAEEEKKLREADKKLRQKEEIRQLAQHSINAENARDSLDPIAIIELQPMMLSDDDIERIGVVRIERRNGEINLDDNRMGVIERGGICETCSFTKDNCNGHFGKMHIPPIYHPGSLGLIVKIARSVCHSCSGFLLDTEQVETHGWNKLPVSERLKEISKVCKGKSMVCTRNRSPACSERNPQYKADKDSFKILKETEEKDTTASTSVVTEILPQDMLTLFKAISNEDAKALGFHIEMGARPENLIFKKILVLPLNLRLPTYFNGNMKPSHYTIAYGKIFEEAEKYFSNVNSDKIKKRGFSESISETQKRIIHEITKLYNDITLSTRTEGEFGNKSMAKALEGKKGILRDNTQSKRVDQSGRTVVGGARYLAFDQAAVPKKLARELTTSETVCNFNRSRLQKLLREGKINFFGESEDRMKYVTKNIRATYELKIGEIVKRQLLDGDMVILNRQPTLSKMSLMAMHIVLSEGESVKIHYSHTTPYNADFDGDEMNIHVPQDLLSRAELEEILSVGKCLYNSSSSSNSMGLVHDSLLAFYILCLETTFVPLYFVQNCLMNVRGFDPAQRIADFKEKLNNQGLSFIIPRDEYEKYGIQNDSSNIPGRYLFSLLLPFDFVYHAKGVRIENGILISGNITKSHIGTSSNSIIMYMLINYGEEEVVNFLTNSTFVGSDFLDAYGYTFGIQDCEIDENKDKELKNQLLEKVVVARGNIESLPDKLSNHVEEDRRQAKIRTYLDFTQGLGEQVLQSLPENSPVRIAVGADVKATTSSILKATVTVGLQTLEGKLLPKALNDGRRCTPFTEIDKPDLIVDNGVCMSSFGEGLGPSEFILHAYASRESSIDSAGKTSKVGVVRQELDAMLTEFKTSYLGGVIDDNNKFLSFTYFGDNFDTERQLFISEKKGMEKSISKPSFIDLQNKTSLLNQKIENYIRIWKEIENKERIIESILKKEKEINIEEIHSAKVASFLKELLENFQYTVLIENDDHLSIRAKYNIHKKEGKNKIFNELLVSSL